MILLDTSFLVAFHNRRDVHHAAASEAMRQLLDGVWGKAMLLEYVFLETVTVLALRRDLRTAAAVGSTLLEAREVEFVPCSDFFVQAFRVFRAQPETRLSFVDAAIVAVARERGIGHVLTFDRGFTGIEGLGVEPVQPSG